MGGFKAEPRKDLSMCKKPDLSVPLLSLFLLTWAFLEKEKDVHVHVQSTGRKLGIKLKSVNEEREWVSDGETEGNKDEHLLSYPQE